MSDPKSIFRVGWVERAYARETQHFDIFLNTFCWVSLRSTQPTAEVFHPYPIYATKPVCAAGWRFEEKRKR